jgi:hypothetical protein
MVRVHYSVLMAFLTGFHELVPTRISQCFLMKRGRIIAEIDVDDWKKNIVDTLKMMKLSVWKCISS